MKQPSAVQRQKLLFLLVPIGIASAGLGGSYIVPLDHPAIQYATGAVDDSVSRLQARIDKGEVRLKYEDEFGYLRSVLHELKVPVSSQVLVFSKTSFQAPRIAPRTPRAVYFNDNLAVGFVRTGEVLEFAALDPKQGIIFYTLDQERSSRPHFERRDTCLQCHQSGAEMGIPGLLVRSVTPDRTGTPVLSAGGFVTDHRSPLSERWGGWYVSGTSGSQTHMGNAIAQENAEERAPVTAGTSNVTDLSPYFDTGAYLSPHSDIVALMVLEHQTQMENLLIRVDWEARMALAENTSINVSLHEPPDQIRPSIQHRIDTAVEELVQYMVFTDEAKLTSPVKGTSGFAEEFSKPGTLRELDLKTRLFRYPCSFMIASPAFDALPQVAKDRVYKRLYEVLTSRNERPTIEIVKQTKKDLPPYWT